MFILAAVGNSYESVDRAWMLLLLTYLHLLPLWKAEYSKSNTVQRFLWIESNRHIHAHTD